MAKSLILGGTDFIGSNLARRLVAQGKTVKILTRPNSSVSNIEDIIDQVEVIYRDFMDEVALRHAIQDVDTVYHLTSTSFPGLLLESSCYDVLSNLVPTIRLVEICLAHGIKKLIYVSSGGTIYGDPQTIPITEEHPLIPRSAYGQGKVTIENYLTFYARSTSLDISVLRVSNSFGPGQSLWGEQGLVAVAMGCAAYGRALKLYGEGKAVRDYIYIDDVIDAMLLTATHPGSSVVNISAAMGHSVMEIVQAVEEISGQTIAKEFIPDRPGDVQINILDNQKAFQLYGWTPKTAFKDGLAQTWNHITETDCSSR